MGTRCCVPSTSLILKLRVNGTFGQTSRWKAMRDQPRSTPQSATRDLLECRAAEATVCPSEVARAMARAKDGQDANWRLFMPDVHAAVDLMAAEGRVRLSWKGQPCPVRTGPYRLHRGRNF